MRGREYQTDSWDMIAVVVQDAGPGRGGAIVPVSGFTKYRRRQEAGRTVKFRW